MTTTRQALIDVAAFLTDWKFRPEADATWESPVPVAEDALTAPDGLVSVVANSMRGTLDAWIHVPGGEDEMVNFGRDARPEQVAAVAEALRREALHARGSG